MLRGAISILIVSTVSLAIAAVVIRGPRVFDSFLSSSIGDFLEAIVASDSPGQSSGSKGEVAADYLLDGAEGLRSTGPIAALAGNLPVFIDEVIAGYTTDVSADAPSEITTIRPITGCLLTRPQSGSIVGHVTAGISDLPLALSTYGDAQLAAGVQVFVDHYRNSDGSPMLLPPRFEAYDVAVTETSAPVYLVLKAGEEDRIWNIHLSPGARVERVILLGGSQVGVANLDPVVPVEVILASGLQDCGIDPALALNAGHSLIAAAGEGSPTRTESEAKLAALAEAIRLYDIWFRDSFGVLASESRTGFDFGSTSLIGPVPQEVTTRAIYAPIRDSAIRTTQDTYFEIHGQTEPGQDFVGRVAAIATAFAFGDLKNLRQGVQF